MNHTDSEETADKVYDRLLMYRLLQYLKPYKVYIGISVLLLLSVAGLRLIGPYLTKVAIDTYIANDDIDGLHRIGIFYCSALLLVFICRFGQIYLTNLAGQKVMYDVRMAVYSHLQRLSVSYYDKNPVGRLITRVTNDIEALNEMFSSGVVSMFGEVFTLIGIMIAMLLLDWKLALISFAVLPLLFYAAMLFRKKVRTAFREVRIIIARMNAHLQESITGMAVIQLFNRQEYNFKEFDEINEGHQNAYIKTIRYYAIFFPAVEVISALAIGLILWYAGGQVIQQALSIGVLIAFLQYVQQFFQPISNLSEHYNTLQAALAASERLFALLDDKPEIENPDAPINIERLNGKIEFDHVWFAYNNDEWVLKDVSFIVEPGQCAAFVGATGAGKSTITNLICRFYDVRKGRILIDDIDIRQLDQSTLRQHIGLVLQDVFLFSATVSENIRLWKDTISETQIHAAANHVNAAPFIDRLEERYETVLGERGGTISSGQRQLLSFARALVYEPTILVLDEATSNIDTETEQLIQEAINSLMADRTSIIIAHRLSTIQHADKIIVLHHGQIVETGTHHELLKAGQVYYKLYQLQYKDQEITIL